MWPGVILEYNNDMAGKRRSSILFFMVWYGGCFYNALISCALVGNRQVFPNGALLLNRSQDPGDFDGH